MKIAIIGNDYMQQFPLSGYGGIETCVENLAWGMHKYLDSTKHSFFCVVPQREFFEACPFPVYETLHPPKTRCGPEFATDVVEILRKAKPDIIWAQSHWSVIPLLSLDIPIICSIHDGLEKKPEGWLVNHPLVKYRFLSENQYKKWVTEPWEKQKSFQLYSGFTDEQFAYYEGEREYFLWVAGLNYGLYGKGLDIFIQLAQKYPKESFVCYGSGNPDIESYLKSLHKYLPNFFYKGELKRGEEHIKAFQKAKAFFMLSRLPESFGRTTVEAMSKGTPVVGTNVGATPEIIGDWRTGGGLVIDSFFNSSVDAVITFGFAEEARKRTFELSKKFHIRKEIDYLLMQSEALINEL